MNDSKNPLVRAKISATLKGRKLSKEHAQNIAKGLKGNTYTLGKRWILGFTRKPITEEARAHFRELGKERAKQLPVMKGDQHPNWKGGVTPVRRRITNWITYKNWRTSVFKRDGYKCFDCGEGGYLEGHHILPLKETLSRAFDINNGITLCRPCHLKTLGKELELMSTYFSFVQVRV